MNARSMTALGSILLLFVAAISIATAQSELPPQKRMAIAPQACVRLLENRNLLARLQESDKCCSPAHATLPPLPKEEKRCKGTQWGVAVPGECFKQKEYKCMMGGKTVVRIHEWELKWNGEEKKCEAHAIINKTRLVEVETCRGDACDD